MKCGRFQNLIFEYAYGELSEAERAALREHLADCPSCARLLAETKQVLTAIPVPPPPDFSAAEKADLRSRVIASACRPKKLTLPSRWAWAAAAAAMLTAGVFWLERSPSPVILDEIAGAQALTEELNEEFSLVAEFCLEIDRLQGLADPVPRHTAGPGGLG